MELDDLKGAWTNAGQPPTEASLNDLITRVRGLRRTIFWRSTREIVVAAVLLPFFAWIGWGLATHGAPVVPLIGVGLMIVGLLLIPAVIVWGRRPREYVGSSIAEHLRTQLAYTDRQISIRQHVGWMLAPGLVGANLFFAGLNVARPIFIIAYVLFTLAIGVLLVRANRRAAHRLRPFRDSLLSGLEAVREPPPGTDCERK